MRGNAYSGDSNAACRKNENSAKRTGHVAPNSNAFYRNGFAATILAMRLEPLTIRQALLSEQQALEALQWRASLGNAGDRDVLLRHPDAIAIPPQQIAEGHVFVAEMDGGIAGFAAVLLRDDDQMELDGLFVEPDLQRRGIGRALVNHCATYAAVHGASALSVIGNPHATAFYAACGFVCEGTQRTRFGEGLVLRKELRVIAPPFR
jgi:GNAT superfamily N-acetyltransferase